MIRPPLEHILRSLPPEELAKIVPPTREQIYEILERGIKEWKAAEQARGSYTPSKIFYR